MSTNEPREQGTLTVHCKTQADSGAVQIEVRKQNLTLVSVTSPSQSVQVPAGHYQIRGIAPDGAEMVGEVSVVSGQDAEVWLEGDEAQSDARTTKAVVSASRRNRSLRRGIPRDAPFHEAAVLEVRAFSGNVLMGMSVPAPPGATAPISDSTPDVREYTIHPGNTSLVQVRAPRTIVNLVPPISPRKGCRLEVRLSSEAVRCDFSLSGDADVFLDAFAAGQLDAASAATQSSFNRDSNALMEIAEDLLEDKLDDPIGAILSGLGLLRMGELEMLGEWTGKLQRVLSWSPDVACLHGEHLARIGDHGRALDAFLTLPSRGLPAFADSMSYALNRLRLYLRVKELSSYESAALDLVQRLQRFSTVTDLRSSFVTFGGEDPNGPGVLPQRG